MEAKIRTDLRPDRQGWKLWCSQSGEELEMLREKKAKESGEDMV